MDLAAIQDQAQKAINSGDVNALEEAVQTLQTNINKDSAPSLLVNFYRFQGTLCSLKADFDGAVASFEKALSILDPLTEQDQIARIANNMGVAYHTKADYPNALYWYRKSMDAREQANDMTGVARVAGNIGILYSSLGDIVRARSFYERSLAISTTLNDPEGIVRSTVALGNMFVREGDLDQAVPLLTDGMNRCKDLGIDREWLTAASSLAAVLRQKEDYQAAIDLVDTAMTAAVNMGLKREQILLSIARSLASYKINHGTDDIESLKDLVTEARTLELANEEKDIHKELYSIYKEQGDAVNALKYHEEWVLVRDKIASDDRQRQLVLLEAEQRIREEQQRMEEHQRLLYNMLPTAIAKRLLTGEQEIADSFENICVLFTDIVGFTQRASELSVEELLALLNGLFSDFDSIVRANGVTKIKTIGDAYMAIAGAPEVLEPIEAAKRIAHTAINLVSAAGSVNIRAGIHIGPAAAGVIGTERMVWDIWGDAVNVAARMEQTSTAGRIQVSEEFARILSNNASPVLEGTDIVINTPPFRMRMRGTIEVKGKGEMKTFWLEYLP